MTADEALVSPYRWVMLAGVSLLFCCFSMVHFSTAALATLMINDLGLSLSQMGSIMGAWPLAYVFLSIPAGLLLDRFGVRFMLLFGIVVIGLSAALRLRATAHGDMFFAVLLFGVGAPFVSVGVPKLIREWFAYAQRGFALGICTAMLATGAVLGLVLTHQLLGVFDGNWRRTLAFYAIVCGISACIWFVIIIQPRCRLHGFQGQRESMREVYAGCLQLLRTPAMRSVLLLSTGMFFYAHIIINWLPKLLSQMQPGLSEAASAWWASLPIVIGIFSAAIVPALSSKGREIPVLTALFVISALSSLLLGSGMTTTVLVVTLALVGIVRGAVPPVASMLLMHLPGVTQKNVGAGTGLFYAFGQVGGVLGPLTFGYLAQMSGGFDLPLYVLAGICVALALLSLAIGRVKNAPL